ncbi:hypothetical protein ACFQX6_59085 [Streptosporangium lutulentum]
MDVGVRFERGPWSKRWSVRHGGSPRTWMSGLTKRVTVAARGAHAERVTAYVEWAAP